MTTTITSLGYGFSWAVLLGGRAVATGWAASYAEAALQALRARGGH